MGGIFQTVDEGRTSVGFACGGGRSHDTLSFGAIMSLTREKAQLMSASEIDRTLVRLAHEILEKTKNLDQLAFIGIRRRVFNRGCHGHRGTCVGNSLQFLAWADLRREMSTKSNNNAARRGRGRVWGRDCWIRTTGF